MILSFSIHRDEFSTIEINQIIEDLEVISQKLKIPNNYAKTEGLQWRIN